MRFFEFGPPNISNQALPVEVEEFLERVWSKFGRYSADKLGELARAHPAYKAAIRHGHGEEIAYTSIAKGVGSEQKLPETLKTADGRVVTRWIPPKR